MRKLLTTGKSPLARLHALWSLKGLAALADDDLKAALSDRSAGVREHAVRIGEARLDKSPALLAKVVALASDPSRRVRFQVAFSLGETTDRPVAAALATIARTDADDPWIRTAVLSSAVERAGELANRLTETPRFVERPGGAGFLAALGQIVGARKRNDEVLAFLSAAVQIDRKVRGAGQGMAVGLGKGLGRSRSSLSAVLGQLPADRQRQVGAMFTDARKTAGSVKAALDQREQAIALLGFGRFAEVEATLVGLLDARQPQRVQLAVVRALAGFTGPKVAPDLLTSWRGTTMDVFAGDTISATIGDTCDVDSFKTTLLKPTFMTFETTGLVDTVMEIVDCETGVDVAFCDDDRGVGVASQIQGCLPAGEYCVSVRGFSAFTTGDYNFKIRAGSECPAADPPLVSADGAMGCLNTTCQ